MCNPIPYCTLALGKWVPEELRAYTRLEDDKPYVPPAYYGDDEEQLDSEDNELQNEASTCSSELEELSQPQDNSESVAETQEKWSKFEELDSVSSSEQSTKNKTHVSNRRKSDGVEDVTVINSDESCRDNSISVATNPDEDASTASSTNGSGIMFVSNSKDGTSSSWSRYQQKQLEWALVKYPKFAKERWENIAKAVPGKSKVKIYSCLTNWQ